MTSLRSSARKGTVAKLYLYVPSCFDALVSKPCSNRNGVSESRSALVCQLKRKTLLR